MACDSKTPSAYPWAKLVVLEVVVVVVPIVPIVINAFLDVLDTFLDVLASFPVILDGSVHAFLSSCWPFVVVIAFEQQSRHQQAGDSVGDSFLVLD